MFRIKFLAGLANLGNKTENKNRWCVNCFSMVSILLIA